MKNDKGKLVTGNHAGSGRSESPGFYAVIPTSVLYDPSLPQGAKILYALISSLAHKTGYCWAGNAYLAKYCNASERTIGYWLVKLHNAGYIIVSFLYYPDSKKIRERRIRLPAPVVKAVDKIPLPNPDDPGEPETVPEVPNDAIPDIAENCGTRHGAPAQKQAEMPKISQNDTISGVATDCNTQDLVLQPVARPGVAMDCRDININSYSDINTAAAALPPGNKAQPPPGEAAAAPFPDQEPPQDANTGPGDSPPPGGTSFSDLKNALAALDASLVFDRAFYPRALAWLEENSLPPAFLAWLYEQCLLKKPASLRGMFYRLFFAPDMAESFKAAYTPPPEAAPVMCPVCGSLHAQNTCPRCGFEPGGDVEFQKKLYRLPPDRRTEYEKRIDRIIGSGDFKLSAALLDKLNEEFALK